MNTKKSPLLTLLLICLASLTSLSQQIMTDQDGNSYHVITIGNQEWMGTNLTTTTYANGENIPQLVAGSAGWSWYNNNQELGEQYGKLYTWEVVNSSKGICPAGWRVPVVEDWMELATFIDPEIWGNNNFVATELKSRRQQNSPHGAPYDTNEHPRWDADPTRFGNDTYSFGALPGGTFSSQSGFFNLGEYAYFWTSTPASEGFAWAAVMLNTHKGLNQSAYSASSAMSVRCIKDEGDEPQPYNLILLTEPLEGGSIEGQGTYNAADAVEVTATPADGFIFTGWYNLQDEVVSTDNPYLFNMPSQNFTLRAIFSEDDTPVVINSFPWTESFESGIFPPNGWQNVDLSGSTATWTYSTTINFTEGGTTSAEHIYGSFLEGSQEDWLISPAIEVPAGSNMVLSFWSYNRWTTWYVKNSVKISSTIAHPETGNYTEVWSPSAIMEGWVRTQIDLAPYAGQTIYIGFVYEGQDAHGWNLDDITIE